MAQILDGKVIRNEIEKHLKSEIETLRARSPLDRKPKLVIIQVGDNPQSNTYIHQKVKFGERIDAFAELKKFPTGVSQETLNSQISILNSDRSVHGIIIQMPIPKNLDKNKLIDTINPKKDVDGLTTTNQNLLENNDPRAIAPATAKGVITMLRYYKIPIKGKKVTVIGRSKLVGAPTATLLKNMGTRVTVCHSQTEDLKAETRGADIIIVAVGKPNLITKNHVSPGQAVIDVGINVIESQMSNVKGQKSEKLKPELETNNQWLKTNPEKRLLVGDVDFENVSKIVAAISPVPGGVGPLTVASLFENLLEAYKKQN